LFHLVAPSPWPLVSSLGGFMLTTGFVLWVNKGFLGFTLMLTGLCTISCVFFTWFRDIIREALLENAHTITVQKGLRLGVILFIVSEVMFFFAFFWAFFHSSFSPTYALGGVWPPKAVTTISTFSLPLTNTFILLSSGASLTWSHNALILQDKKHTILSLTITIFLACFFTCLQLFEYFNAPFCISDGIYGSCFYLTTGFHGFHVFVGTIGLLISLYRISANHFSTNQHIGFESAIWYWHFVDVVWLFLFACVYWWSS